MIAFATELSGWLLATGALAAVGGFFAGRAGSKPASAQVKDAATSHVDIVLESSIEALHDEIAAKNEEVDELRARLADPPSTADTAAKTSASSPNAQLEESLSSLEAQIATLRDERDEHKAALSSTKERNQSLQRRLDETADRLVELERDRMHISSGSHPPVISKDPAVRREVAIEAPSAAVATVEPEFKPAPTPTPEIEVADPASIMLEVEKSQPLSVAHESDPEPAPTPEIGAHAPTPSVATASATESSDDLGFARDLSEIHGLSADVAERLGLIGMSTNLDLLRKAGSATGRNGLAKSMRLEPDVLLAFIHAADLTRVGLRNEDIDRLRDAGVETLLKLTKSDAGQLAKRLEAIQSRRRSSDKPTDHETVERWIHRANELEALIES